MGVIKEQKRAGMTRAEWVKEMRSRWVADHGEPADCGKDFGFFPWVRWKSIGQLLEVLHNLVSVIKGYYVGRILVYCGAVVLNQGDFCPSGTWQYLETFLFVTTQGGGGRVCSIDI